MMIKLQPWLSVLLPTLEPSVGGNGVPFIAEEKFGFHDWDASTNYEQLGNGHKGEGKRLAIALDHLFISCGRGDISERMFLWGYWDDFSFFWQMRYWIYFSLIHWENVMKNCRWDCIWQWGKEMVSWKIKIALNPLKKPSLINQSFINDINSAK